MLILGSCYQAAVRLQFEVHLAAWVLEKEDQIERQLLPRPLSADLRSVLKYRPAKCAEWDGSQCCWSRWMCRYCLQASLQILDAECKEVEPRLAASVLHIKGIAHCIYNRPCSLSAGWNSQQYQHDKSKKVRCDMSIEETSYIWQTPKPNQHLTKKIALCNWRFRESTESNCRQSLWNSALLVEGTRTGDYGARN